MPAKTMVQPTVETALPSEDERFTSRTNTTTRFSIPLVLTRITYWFQHGSTCKKKGTIMNGFPGINKDNGLLGPSTCDLETLRNVYRSERETASKLIIEVTKTKPAAASKEGSPKSTQAS